MATNFTWIQFCAGKNFFCKGFHAFTSNKELIYIGGCNHLNPFENDN